MDSDPDPADPTTDPETRPEAGGSADAGASPAATEAGTAETGDAPGPGDGDPVLARAPESVLTDLERLRSEWGTVPVRARTERFPAEEYDPDRNAEGVGEDGVFRYGAAWVREDGRVLLVQPHDDEGWCEPGGRREPEEGIAETARRETREETGLAVELVDVVEAIVTVHEYGDRATEWAVGAVFDARPVGGDLRPQPEEIADLRWFEDVPDREDLVFPYSAEYPDPDP